MRRGLTECSQSRLIVKIKNKGEGYQRDLYGDTIIVERGFTVDGSSSYKLKSEAGKIISTKKETLDEITDYFQIQVDNPMNILTQDKAREFLATSTDKQKYEFFMKGVQLDKLQSDYEVLRDSADKITTILNSKRELVGELKKQLEKAEARYKQTRKLDDLRRQVDQRMKQFAWAQIEEQEAKVKKEEENFEAAQARVEKTYKKVEEEERAYEKSKEVYNQSVQTHERIKEEAAPLREEAQDKLDDWNKRKDEVTDIRASQRVQHEQMKSFKQSATAAQRRLDEEIRRVKEAEGGIPRWEKALEDATKKKEELQQLGEQILQEQRGCLEKHGEVKRELSEITARVEELRKQVSERQEQVRSLRTGTVSDAARFGGNAMPRIIEGIRRENRWKERPIGPIANHVKLLNTEWQPTIETILSGSLTAFIVFSNHDQRLLSEIMKRAG